MSIVGLMSINPAGAVPELNTLRNRLRTAREFAGLRQVELAEKAGISRATISAAENGAKSPSSAVMTVWAWACEVNLDWLKTGTAKTPSPDGDGVAVRHEGFEPPTF